MLFCYEASRVPRYSSVSGEAAIVGNIIEQRAFFSTILSLSARLHGLVELRFRSDNKGRIRVFIAIEVPDDSERRLLDTEIRVAERLLPRGYSWARCDEVTLDGELSRGSLRIARLVRSIEFIDLPPASDVALERLMKERVTPVAAVDNGTASGPVSGSMDRQRPLNGADFGMRELPPLLYTAEQLANLRLCLPVLGTLNNWRAELRTFLEELVASGPAAASICMRPPTTIGELDQANSAAVFWCLCQNQFVGPGAGDPRSVADGFSRYGLPAGHLAHTMLRCGATNDRDAVAIASVLAACLGGLRSFSVIAPTIDSSVGALRDPWIDYPKTPLKPNPSDMWKELALRSIRASPRVSEPDEIEALDFLLRAPHLYTLDEVEMIAQLPFAGEAGLPGLDVEMVPPFYGQVSHEGSTVHSVEREVRIGLRVDSHGLMEDRRANWHKMPVNDLTKHALVVGSTGSGKTVATTFLLWELYQARVPFLVVEPVKTEYLNRLKAVGIPETDVKRWRFEGNEAGGEVTDFLAFDPMYLQRGVTVARHASYLKSCFEAAFPLDAVSALILEHGIREYYTQPSPKACGFSLFTRGGPESVRRGKRRDSISAEDVKCIHPSLNGFMSFFLFEFLPLAIQPTGKQSADLLENWTQLFKRRFNAIRTGLIGRAAEKAIALYHDDPANYDPFKVLVERNTIIELDGIPDDEHKALLMAFIFSFLYERRQADDFSSGNAKSTAGSKLRHVLVIEEAHRLLTNTSQAGRGDLAGLGAKAKSVATFVDMLAEVRSYGQGLIIVEQIPTKIVPEAVKNTNLKVMLRLTAADDREYLGSAMNLTDEQKKFVTSLRTDSEGVNMVVFEQQSDQPRLLKLPFVSVTSGAAS